MPISNKKSFKVAEMFCWGEFLVEDLDMLEKKLGWDVFNESCEALDFNVKPPLTVWVLRLGKVFQRRMT